MECKRQEVTYCGDEEGCSEPLSKQVIQLLPGEGVHHEAENEEGGQEETHQAAHEGVKLGALVVAHILSVEAQICNSKRQYGEMSEEITL